MTIIVIVFHNSINYEVIALLVTESVSIVHVKCNFLQTSGDD